MAGSRLASRVAVGLLVLLVGAAQALAAGTGWTITLNPTTITAATASTIKVAFTNFGGPDGTRELGCVRISVPLTFTISHVAVTGQPPGTSWSASAGALLGLGLVTFKTSSGGDRLPPDGTSTVTGAITVRALTPGTYTWTANAYRQQDCTDPFNQPIALKVVVDLAILPTPKPTPTPTQIPTPTPRPTPTPTARPLPTPLVTLVPSILPSIVPPLLPTPTPTPTQIPTTPPQATPTPPATGVPATPGPVPTDQGGGPTATFASTPGSSPGTTPPPAADADPPVAEPTSSPPLGAALILPGTGPDDGSTGPGQPAISLTSGFETPFGNGFEWAVPGLVLSVPGLLIVLVAIVAQAFGAMAWLPVVRRRIGGFDLDPHRERGASGSAD